MTKETPDTFEIWKPVVGFEGCYEVSNTGKVRNIRQRKGVLRPGLVGRDPRPAVSLQKDGIAKTYYVHRIMGFAFLGLNGDLVIDHINRNTQDNRLENLQVVTRKRNSELRAMRNDGTESMVLWYVDREKFNQLGDQNVKRCRKCNLVKKISEFGTCMAKTMHKDWKCKACTKILNKKYNARTK